MNLPTLDSLSGYARWVTQIWLLKLMKILYISFPHQLLHALAAVNHERLENPDQANASMAIIVWCYDAAQHLPNSLFRQQFAAMLQAYSEIDLWIPSYLSRITQLSPLRQLRARSLSFNQRFEGRSIGLIAYSHDISVDHTAQALFQAWPNSRRVCFGDPPGFLYSDNEIEEARVLKKSVLRYFISGKRSPDDGINWRFADSNRVAVLFGDETSGPVTEVPLTVLNETLKRLQIGLKQIDDNCRQWLEHQIPKSVRPCLLLLSNLTESGITTAEAEIELYQTIVRTSLPPGSYILIKPHPGTSNRMQRTIAKSMHAYRVSVLPQGIGLAPVELLPSLISSCRIYSISSASVLLTKLFGADTVSHQLTDDLIQTYFDPRWHSHFFRANRSIQKALQLLQND